MNYSITMDEIAIIRERDKTCVYCRKKFDFEHSPDNRKDWDTVEHLNHKADWNSVQSFHLENKPVPEIVTICCWSCNSSRSSKPLLDWFKSAYCMKYKINYQTVSEVVKKYIDTFEYKQTA